jgi:hypothetical protein
MPNILELMQLPQIQHGIRRRQHVVRGDLGGTQGLPCVRTYLGISAGLGERTCLAKYPLLSDI